MAYDDASATSDNSVIGFPESSPGSDMLVETTLGGSLDDAVPVDTSTKGFGTSNTLGRDSDDGKKRDFSQVDNYDETPRSSKTPRIANQPEPESDAVQSPLRPNTEASAMVETNLRSSVMSMPMQLPKINYSSGVKGEDTGAHMQSPRPQEDDGSTGLSSPISYRDDDDLQSSNFEQQQGRTNDDSEGGTATPPSSMSSATETVDKYTMMKTSGRTRRRPELYGAPVATALVVQDEETEDFEPVEQSAEKPEEASAIAHKQARATRKNTKQSGSVTKALKAEKTIEDSKNKIKGLEDKVVRNIKKTARRSKKTNSTVHDRNKARPKSSKQVNKTDLQSLATKSCLGRWVLRNSTATSKKKHVPFVVTLPLLEIDEDLLALSNKMTERLSMEDKPETKGKPDVWADSRQSLCETLVYFKRPQGGCYSNDGHVYGFLFDAIGHCREYMDENVVLCRAGGSMEGDNTGGMVQRKDHSVDHAQVKAVLNDITHHNPVVLICGDRNAAARCKMPYKYCVLGWYKPTMVWSEKTAGKGGKVWTTIKYRLERLNSHVPAWHAANEALLSEDERAAVGEVIAKTCNECYSTYPQIYLRGWMCLNDKCARFWKFRGVVEAPYGNEPSLSYHPAFLLHKSELWNEHHGLELEPAPLRPPVPDIGHAIGDNLTYINTRGICCPKCGRCSSRRFFKGWICENPNCDFELSTMHRPVSPAMLHTPWDVAPTLVRNSKNASVSLRVEHKYGYKLSIYTFHGIRGCFIHALATKPLLEEKNGPNDMFANMQVEDMGLERRTFATKKASTDSKVSADHKNEAAADLEPTKELSPAADEDNSLAVDHDGGDADSGAGEKKPSFADGDLMTAFSMNYGMPYKFVASGGSKPFDEGPWPISETRRRLNWAARTFLNNPEQDMDLNELLVFAYLESQKLEYHDDGEEGLGPRIATLSLGGKAKMHMRMKAKFYVGCSKTGILVEEKPVAGGLECEKRLQAWTELQDLKATDPAAYNRRRKEVPKELGLYEKRMKKAEDLVTVTLSHGDIVIMDGYDIQKYLEHKVVSEGYLRFALTCRTVLENHLKAEERPAYEVRVDEQVYDGPNI